MSTQIPEMILDEEEFRSRMLPVQLDGSPLTWEMSLRLRMAIVRYMAQLATLYLEWRLDQDGRDCGWQNWFMDQAQQDAWSGIIDTLPAADKEAINKFFDAKGEFPTADVRAIFSQVEIAVYGRSVDEEI